jgi:hypothetical protein
LQEKEYRIGPNDLVEVEESNPNNIYNKVKEKIADCTGSIGLNYTGGTKTMSVHAYRALEKADAPQKYYSYLDARRLSMVFSDRASPLSVGTRVTVSLKELLDLHGLPEQQQEMKGSDALIWPHTTQALATIYANEEQQKTWRDWLRSLDLKTQTIEDIPYAYDSLSRALHEDTGFAFSTPLENLRQTTSDVIGWLRATWLEEYVFRQITSLGLDFHINDVKMSINPKIGTSSSNNRARDFEFDVGFMRGYQFFGLSCTTEDGAKKRDEDDGNEKRGYSILKSKLFEVSARAEQLGGGEAQFALVCCANPERVQNLKKEMTGLPGAKRLRVFGRNDLLTLQDRLKEWIKEASAT